MANKKCKMCGQYKPLMGDYCAECQSVLAYETNTLTRRIVEEMIETEDDPDIGNVSTFDSFNALMQKQAEERKKEQEAVPTKKEAYDAIFQQIMQNNGITNEDIKKYRSQLQYIVKLYLFHLMGGHFRLTDKASFQKIHPGDVVAVKGRWVVYKLKTIRNDGIPVDLRPEIKEYLTSVEIAINKALKSSKEADKIFGTPATDTQA